MNRILFNLLLLSFLIAAGAAQADIWYRDLDGDGWGDLYDWVDSPTQPAGYVLQPGDCDDNDHAIHPEAVEIPADGVDSDCDGHELCFEDLDDDGWGTEYLVAGFGLGCDGPGEAHLLGDCDDMDGSVNPGATEVPGNDLDEDCDAWIDCYADWDEDLYGSSTVVPDAVPSGIGGCLAGGYADNSLDCDDYWSDINPGATEICGDGIDNDCSGEADEGCLELAITAITDVGNDQGGQVRIRWYRSYDDQPGVGETITAYDIYRRIDAYKSADREKAWPPGDWDFVMQVPASGEDTYHAVVPTLCDSTYQGTCWSVFFLRARTTSPYVFEDCVPDSGYSIDNLAPLAPENLAAAYSADEVALQWDESEAADFAYFKIYRSTEAGFVPSPELLIHTTSSIAWTDPTSDAWQLHYEVTTVDFAGNEGPPAFVELATGTDLPGLTGRLALHPNVPNPFNPSTTIVYELPKRSRVRLEIYALDGSRVAVLDDGWREAGLQRAVWNGRTRDGGAAASGAYVCRLAAQGKVLARQITLVK